MKHSSVLGHMFELLNWIQFHKIKILVLLDGLFLHANASRKSSRIWTYIKPLPWTKNNDAA